MAEPDTKQDTKDLDALLDSLNGSAERFQTLWFSFLGLTLYFAIAALATTHRNLLLGEPQTLPILNIKVELLPFYVIAPLLYLVFHFYLLMMLALLARPYLRCGRPVPRRRGLVRNDRLSVLGDQLELRSLQTPKRMKTGATSQMPAERTGICRINL